MTVNCSGILNSTTNCNDTNQTQNIGTVRILSDATIVTMHILYLLVLIVGIFGNILTCMVIICRKSMRRSIHFYTFNLAICDLFVLFFYVTTQMVFIWNQLKWTMGLGMCKVNNAILPIMLYASLGTLFAITIDRARGLIQPFKWRADSARQAKIAIPLIWLGACLISIPLLIFPKLGSVEIGGEIIVYCSEGWPSQNYERGYWLTMFVLVFLAPLVAIFIVHVVMIIVLFKDRNSSHRDQNKRMIQMIVAVVVVFTICTGIQHVYFFVVTYANIEEQKIAMFYIISNFFVSLQAALNPIIYGTLRQDFNKAFKGVFLKLLRKLKIKVLSK